MKSSSERTRNENLLRTRTKSFKTNIKESEDRMRSSSSLNNLAGKLYSQRINKNYSPRKTANKESTISKNASTGMLNPQMLISATMNMSMSGLSMRASHVPSFAEMNTTLLRQKKELERKIAALKQGIVQQKKKLNHADYNCKKNRNEIQNFTDMYNQAHAKSLKLNENIDATEQECHNLQIDIRRLRKRIDQRRQEIEREKRLVEEFERETKNLKLSVMQEEKIRNHTKGELSKNQRVMNSASIYYKQLENEKAMLLLQINQSVNTYKL